MFVVFVQSKWIQAKSKAKRFPTEHTYKKEKNKQSNCVAFLLLLFCCSCNIHFQFVYHVRRVSFITYSLKPICPSASFNTECMALPFSMQAYTVKFILYYRIWALVTRTHTNAYPYNTSYTAVVCAIRLLVLSIWHISCHMVRYFYIWNTVHTETRRKYLLIFLLHFFICFNWTKWQLDTSNFYKINNRSKCSTQNIWITLYSFVNYISLSRVLIFILVIKKCLENREFWFESKSSTIFFDINRR